MVLESTQVSIFPKLCTIQRPLLETSLLDLLYRQEISTFQLVGEKLFRFAHIAYAYVVKTE